MFFIYTVNLLKCYKYNYFCIYYKAFKFMKKINQIINEEISILNENISFEPEQLLFNQLVTNPGFYNFDDVYDNYDEQVVNSNIGIQWRLGFDIQESGIKNIIPYIINVYGDYDIELRDIHSDELIQRIAKDISEIKWEFKIENFILSPDKPTYVDSVSFDMKTRICEVDFI